MRTDTTAWRETAAGRAPRRLARLLLGLLALAVAVAAAGALFQLSADAAARRAHPAPGKLVAVGGHRLHFYPLGERHRGPTVVLEAGGTSFSAQWAWVQPAVAEFAHVVSYDRAGLGWSEAGEGPASAARAADELRALLEAAGAPGPYILVGHSYGGMVAQVFADHFRDEVAGVVLVDTNDHRLFGRLPPEALAELEGVLGQHRLLPTVARLGVLRALNPFEAIAAPLPEPQRSAAAALFLSNRHAVAARGEAEQIYDPASATQAQLAAVRDLGAMPLVVLSRSEPPGAFTEAIQANGAELAARSAVGEQRVVPGSDHLSLVTDREHAQHVVAAVRDVLAQAEAGERSRSP
ncbi:MAG TPA: alpha/beta hydrolase, partial [Chloroflexaceae bacterium]|nr:alpha/beta hydrolase [Chloroflexaceae bacterium]